MASTATAAKAAAQPADISTELRKMIAELGDQFFERREILEALMVCILAKAHGFLLGPPGTGKTNLISELCNRVIGANFFDVLLDRQLGKEEMFGPIDIPLYEKQGVWERDAEGFIPWAHIVFADEVGKAGPAVLNQMLWAMNERRWRNGKTVHTIPLVSFFGASNELLEPELAALWDRFLVRVDVDYIQEASNFKALLATATRPANASPTTVALSDLEHAIENVIPRIVLPTGIEETILKLRLKLREKEIRPSDRRWKAAVRLLQAMAYLNGRTAIDDDDLQILQHVLWDAPEHVTTVRQEVLASTSELTRQAVKIEQELAEIAAATKAQAAKAVDARASFGTEAKHKLDSQDSTLRDLIEKAKRQGRSTAKLEAVRDTVKAIKVEVYVTCLNMSPEKAQERVVKNN